MKNPQKMTVLVTGGAGFVGSHLCRRLAKEGHHVISLDNYFTGSEENHVSGVDYRRGHTRDISQHVPETPDLVFHLGEYSRVEKSLEDPIELVWDLNIAGTFSVLEYCKRKKSKIVYAGSSTKFADGGAGRSQSPYAWTKATNSELVKNYGEWFGLSYAITYFYNVYGPGEIASGPYSTVIGIFKQEYRHGRPITIVSPGTQTRCFTHVDDIVSGLLLVADKGQGDGYEIGNDRAYSIIDVAKLFDTDIVYLPERQGNRLTTTIDTNRMRALGWRANVSLEDHIREYRQMYPPEVKKGEKRILVLTTSFTPHEGTAESALRELMQRMPEFQFDVITSWNDRSFASIEKQGEHVTIYRVGRGDRFDKYRLMYQGLRKAKELSKQHSYLFVWAIMASYAAIAAARFRREKETPLLITLADQQLDRLPLVFRMIVGSVLKTADQISTSSAHQEEGVSRIAPRHALSRSNRSGDVFANQIRFVYNSLLRLK